MVRLGDCSGEAPGKIGVFRKFAVAGNNHIAKGGQEVVGQNHGDLGTFGFQIVFSQFGKDYGIDLISLQRLDDRSCRHDFDGNVVKCQAGALQTNLKLEVVRAGKAGDGDPLAFQVRVRSDSALFLRQQRADAALICGVDHLDR
ncbi:hypothetical protein D3C72_1940730 [compost metagenome]